MANSHDNPTFGCVRNPRCGRSDAKAKMALDITWHLTATATNSLRPIQQTI